MPRRFLAVLLLPAIVIAVGTVGYVIIEGWTWFDALYMTVMTVTTVGFREVHDLSLAGQAFTIFLMLGGIFTLFYAAGEIIRTVVSGQVQAALGRQRMERSLAEMKNHMIVCGYGRMGRLVCKEFSVEGIPFVVIEKRAELLEDFQLPHGLALHGDATADEILRKAGIERARALVTLVASDADNLYITMSARLLSDKLFIVSRAEDEPDEKKLLRAGANRVVSPYLIGGNRVAQAVLRPTVVDFIELATRTEHLEIQIEEVQIAAGSRLVGVVLKDSQIRQQFGVIIVAIKKGTGKMIFNPPGESVLEAGDILIVLGNVTQLDQLEKMARA
jgi:voltage-gated potassium channel